MPTPCPGDEGYDYGNAHTEEDIRRVARELDDRPRDVVPVEPDPAAWDRIAEAGASPRSYTYREEEVLLDPEGVPGGVAVRERPVVIGRAPGQPLVRDEIAARYADPRAELGDDYDPDVHGPLPA